MNLGTLGLLFLLTLFLQDLQQRSALDAGIAVLPLFLPLSLLAPVAGRITARAGPRMPMVVGLLLVAAGVGQIATWSAATPYPHLVAGMLAWGVGLGLLTPAMVAAVLDAVPPDRSGLASGVNNATPPGGRRDRYRRLRRGGGCTRRRRPLPDRLPRHRAAHRSAVRPGRARVGVPRPRPAGRGSADVTAPDGRLAGCQVPPAVPSG